jgi:alpha-glucan,water dikinase
MHLQIPFSTFEEILKRRENKGLATELTKAVKAVQPGDGAGVALGRCRELVMQVPVPDELQSKLREAMQEGGIPVPEGEQWNDAMRALKVCGLK